MEPHIRKSIEDLVTCVICRDLFKNPRQLPCSHIYCRACIIERHSIYRHRFSCPRRDDCVVDSDEIDSLPVNHTARDLAEFCRKCESSSVLAELTRSC